MDKLRHVETTAFKRRYGPWALVTGASDGIGREIARELAQRGLNVILVARREAALRELSRELQTFNVETKIVALDFGAPRAPSALLESCQDYEIGLFVAAAGFGTSGAFTEIEPDVELNMIDVNCRAVVESTHYFARRFKSQGRGGIVLMSSLVAFQGVPRATTYAASKAFVQSLAEGLQQELAEFNIDVLASAPGPVASGFMSRARMASGLSVSSRTVAKRTVAGLGRKSLVRPGILSKVLEWSLMPLPRWGRVRMMGLVMAGMTRHITSRADAPAGQRI